MQTFLWENIEELEGVFNWIEHLVKSIIGELGDDTQTTQPLASEPEPMRGVQNTTTSLNSPAAPNPKHGASAIGRNEIPSKRGASPLSNHFRNGLATPMAAPHAIDRRILVQEQLIKNQEVFLSMITNLSKAVQRAHHVDNEQHGMGGVHSTYN